MAGFSGVFAQTWQRVTAPAGMEDVQFERVACLDDEQTCFMIGYKNGSILFRSRDAGSTWDSLLAFPGQALTSLFFLHDTISWMPNDNGVVFKTTNQWASWDTLYVKPNVRLNDIQFIDENTGWVGGHEIFGTTNGGAAWTQQSNGVYFIQSVAIRNGQTAFVCGNNGIIGKTTNGGANWQVLVPPGGDHLYQMRMATDNIGVAVGHFGTVLRTTDGSGFNTVSVPTTNILISVAHAGGGQFWAVGVAGTIIHSADSGATWTDQSVSTGAELRGVYFTSPALGFAVGDSGRVYRYTNCSLLSDSLVQTGNQLSAYADNAAYQWVNCADNSDISGATGKTYTPQASGRYAVKVKARGCEQLSRCVTIDIPGSGIVTPGQLSNTLRFYPNPAGNLVTVEHTRPGSAITILDISGREIIRTTTAGTTATVDVTPLTNGIYLIQTRENATVTGMGKLVIQK